MIYFVCFQASSTSPPVTASAPPGSSGSGGRPASSGRMLTGTPRWAVSD